jgi:superoxide reductase
MVQALQVYKCEKCGNIIEVLHAGHCVPTCCDQPMKLMEENTVDAAKEKHVPVLEKVAEGWKVTVGAVPHPMEEKHYIEFVELIADGRVYRANFKPGDVASAVFPVQAAKVTAREYCNLHGLWKASN